jgi:quinol monooxygenase YgiN
MDMPWTKLARVDPGQEYLVLLSYLPLRKYSKIPAFVRYSLQVQRQMRNTPGAIGYSMRAKILNRNFWTLSVWKDDRALTEFVRTAPHGEVMKSIAPHMGATKFTKWKLQGSAVPPTWDDAMKREAQEK